MSRRKNECQKTVSKVNKVGRISPMVAWSEFRMRQYRDDDHREDALHFKFKKYRYNYRVLN